MIELDSPTDTSIYSDDRDGLLCDYLTSSGGKDIKAPPILPLAIEKVKLDSLTETSIVKPSEVEGKIVVHAYYKLQFLSKSYISITI